MSTVKTWIFKAVDLVYSVKENHLQWLQTNQAKQSELEHARALADQALAADLKKRSIELEHEIGLLKTKHKAELSMYKTKCKQDVKDYRQYLAALDQLKAQIQTSYADLPEAVAFTIHHHAKALLNEMWDAEDYDQKLQHEMRLIRFMTTVHEDAYSHREGADKERLPERTLKLIRQK